MDKTKLDGRQVFFLLSLYELAALIPGVGARHGWLVCLLLGVCAAALTLTLGFLNGREPMRLLERLGRISGRALGLLLAAAGVAAAAAALRELMFFLYGIGFSGVRTLLGAGLLALLLWWMTDMEADAVGRAAWLSWPAAAVLLLVCLIASVGRWNFSELLPVLDRGVCGALEEARTPALALLLPLPLALLSLAPHAQRTALRPALWAAAASFGLAALCALRDTAVLGGALAGSLPDPSYQATAALARGVLLQPQLLTAGAWMLSLPFRAALPLRLSRRLLTAACPQKHRLWPPLLAGLALAVSLAWK